MVRAKCRSPFPSYGRNQKVNGSRQMPFAFPVVWREPKGKWFAPNAVRLSRRMEGTKRPLIRLLLLLRKYKRNHLPIQTHSSMSRFVTAVRPVPHSGCLYQSLQKFGLLAMTLWFWRGSQTARMWQGWFWSDIWSKLFLIWTKPGHFYYGKVVPSSITLTDCLWTFWRDVPKAKCSSKSSTVIFM